jgi:ATPase subunit of ABC transporter with duplicated ATPase domains
VLVLDVNNINKNFGYSSLFENLSFSLNEGERISIVGPNGCGKSTLLKIISGLEKLDSGMINIKKNTKIAYLDQTTPDNFDNRLVIDVLKDSFADLLELQAEMDGLLKKMQVETDEVKYEKIIGAYGRIVEKFEHLDGYNIETKIRTVCSGFNISEEMLYQNYNNLSGGEKTLIHLAKSLLVEPDLFLLDEPTNHLDISKIEWLETYIKNFKGALITVSHDRYFLDKISSKILEIDNGEAVIYNTNYSEYVKEKEINFQKQMADYKNQQLYFKRLKEQIDFFANMGMTRNSSTMTKRASSLQTRYDREQEKAVRRPQEQKNINLSLNEIRKSSKRIIETKKLCVFTPQRKIVDNANIHIAMGEKIAIIGDNGSGKSTFIKTLLGQQTLPFEGDIFIGPSVKIGYLPQIINFENDNQELLEYFEYETNLDQEKSRSILSRFLFDKEDIKKRVGNLSGGEKIRVRLAVLLQQKINTLIFDEPTNHIDIPTKEILEDTLSDFEGTFIFVSHDRYFINKFAERVIVFKNGKTKNYLGNYEDYIREEQKIANPENNVIVKNKKSKK